MENILKNVVGAQVKIGRILHVKLKSETKWKYVKPKGLNHYRAIRWIELPFRVAIAIVASAAFVDDATKARPISHVRRFHFVGAFPDLAQAHRTVESIEYRQRHRHMCDYRPRPKPIEIQLNRMTVEWDGRNGLAFWMKHWMCCVDTFRRVTFPALKWPTSPNWPPTRMSQSETERERMSWMWKVKRPSDEPHLSSRFLSHMFSCCCISSARIQYEHRLTCRLNNGGQGSDKY